jgi:NAD dependent epimerase/dehydratase family
MRKVGIDGLMKTILLTGASGRIGRTFYEATRERYNFVLADIREPEFEIASTHRYEALDLSDPSSAQALVTGVDRVVHLAGVPNPDATFDEILPVNIMGTTFLMEAAAKAGCKRFVFASSAQTIEGYPVDKQVPDGGPVSPANLYGVSKCYGEALGAYFASKFGLSVVAIRIGAFEPLQGHQLTSTRDLSAWLSPRDAVHLLECAIAAPDIKFFIAHGISNNRFKRLDLTATRQALGYAPQDDAFHTFDVAAFLRREAPAN